MLWLLSLLLDSIILVFIYIALAGGILLYIASKLVAWIPFMGQYKLPAEVVGVILLILGSYLIGGHHQDVKLKDRVKELEAKIVASEYQSREANNMLENTIKEKNKTVRDTQIIIKDRIIEGSAKMDATCKIDDNTINILNDAAKNTKGAK